VVPELELKFILVSLVDNPSVDLVTANAGTSPGIVGRKKGADFCNRIEKIRYYSTRL